MSEPQEITTAPAPALEPAPESALRVVGRRLRYWSPVLALMLLFGEIAFLGLRPALAESRRLDTAAPAVEERLARAQDAHERIELQLRARRDPIYQERLRRLRLFPTDGR